MKTSFSPVCLKSVLTECRILIMESGEHLQTNLQTSSALSLKSQDAQHLPASCPGFSLNHDTFIACNVTLFMYLLDFQKEEGKFEGPFGRSWPNFRKLHAETNPLNCLFKYWICLTAVA